MLSVAFEFGINVHEDWQSSLENFDRQDALNAFLICFSAVLCLFMKSSRLGILLFAITAVYEHSQNWMVAANHRWLAIWTIPMAIVFNEWWRSEVYSLYLRITLGMVMLAAFAQKVLAGTYIDGSYIYFLSAHGGPTERLFSFACDMSAGVPCLAHKLIGQFIMVWQFAVGVLLLLGIRSILFLAIEVGFLLGAGLFADEMNFQVLNIALLCIVFNVGMPIWLLSVCIALLVLDFFGLGYLYSMGLQYVF